jgi:hypothetical protein
MAYARHVKSFTAFVDIAYYVPGTSMLQLSDAAVARRTYRQIKAFERRTAADFVVGQRRSLD